MDSTILERRQAINTLFIIADNPNCNKSFVIFQEDVFGNSARARFLRIKDFVDYGIIKINCTGSLEDNTFRETISLTDAGIDLIECLRKIQAIPTQQPVYDVI